MPGEFHGVQAGIGRGEKQRTDGACDGAGEHVRGGVAHGDGFRMERARWRAGVAVRAGVDAAASRHR